MTEFKPEYAGKMNFYLSAVDDCFGLILCKTKNKLIAEYALCNIQKPIGIADFRLTEKLPQNLKGSLPTVEELEIELCRRSNEYFFMKPLILLKAEQLCRNSVI